jgi:hypothetical protein
VRMILNCVADAQPDPTAAATTAIAISAIVNARSRPAVSQAGLRAAAQARTPVAAAVAVAAVAMHCAHMRRSMAGTPFTAPAMVRLRGLWTRSS